MLLRGLDVRDEDPLALRRRVVLVPQLPAPLAETIAGDVRYAALDAAALDAAARDAVEATIASLGADGGRSIVIVTHDPEQAARLADHQVRLG